VNTDLGGAGNVILNVHALGAEPIICSVIGQDTEGQNLLGELEKRQACAPTVFYKVLDRITTIKERIIAGTQQVVRVDTETDKVITNAEQNTAYRQSERVSSQAAKSCFFRTMTKEYFALMSSKKSRILPIRRGFRP
jgi:bifunctional ADP-heptose synthase (sugar kinase/adenylyltransferase)